MKYPLLLLADPSHCLRYRVFKELLEREDDEEVLECGKLREEDPALLSLLGQQNPDGSWSRLSSVQGGDYNKNIATSQALRFLAMAGFDPDYGPAAKGIEYLFSTQENDGSWPLPSSDNAEGAGKYTSVSLQTSLPLQGLAAVGLAEDERCQKAYDWLLGQRLPDGSWPTGKAGNIYGYVAGYRRLAHSRWGCRSNTTSAVLCLANHPELRNSDEAAKGLDHLLGRETREKKQMGSDLAVLTGKVPLKGFFTFYAKFDLLLQLQLCAKIGAGPDDKRIDDLISFFEHERNGYGLWVPSAAPELSSWATLQILSALKNLKKAGFKALSGLSTPFAPYTRQRERY